MKNWMRFWLFLILAAGLTQCSADHAANETSKTERGTPVKIARITPRPFSDYLNITGIVKARSEVNIVAEEAGILKKVLIDKGRFAHKGDTLAVLDNAVLAAGYREAQAALRQAELDFKSKKVLYAKKAISENDYLSSRYALERARASYDLMHSRYQKLFLKAPFDGYVNDRMVDLGNYVLPTQAVFNFLDNAVVKIRAGVAERFLGDIKLGTPVEITFDAYPELKIESKVSFISRKIENASRTFQVEIETPNPDGKLAPDMVANLKILRRQYQHRIVLPLDALIESEKGRYVFVENNGIAHKKMVHVVAVYQDSVLVDGLASEQNLIVLGEHALSDGDTVMIVKN